MTLLRRAWLLVVISAVGSTAFAQPSRPPIRAQRATAPVSVNARLDEPAWAEAPIFDQFVETFPREGAPPPAGFRTEARVLYDDEFLYVGVRCLDPDPSSVNRRLARRDTATTADRVEIALDPSRSGQSGYVFIVNAAGVQRDVLLFGDVSSTATWDAVWDGAARVDATGWTAELAIPLRVLRFPRRAEQSWRIAIRRIVPRTHQTFDSAAIPREANPTSPGNLVVSRFGELTGLVGLNPGLALELAPYVAADLTQRPQYSDPSRPTPTLLDPGVDVGLDLKASLTSSLTLSAAVNPDFGQVEADQLILNISNNEQFFPEKRPFFTEGLDLFQPVGAEFGTMLQMFYSRRIGLDAPILGALKLAGSVREGTEIGVLDAVVMGAGNPSTTEAAYAGRDLTPFEDDPDRRWQFHLASPLHFGPNDALPPAPPVPRNALAAVVRQRLAPGAKIGAMVTSMVPLAPRCRPEDFSNPADYDPVRCASAGGNGAAFEWDVRRGDWGFFGQLNGSQAVGGPPGGRLRNDGQLLRDGELGYGFYFRAGKLGGEGFRYDVDGVFVSPKLDLNALGFHNHTNFQWYDFSLRWVKPNGVGPFRSVNVSYTFDHLNFSTDGRWIPRGQNHFANASFQLPSFDTVRLQANWQNPQYDLKEIPFTGIGVERAPAISAAIVLETDANRPLYGSFVAARGQIFPMGVYEGGFAYELSGNVVWNPIPALETSLDFATARQQLSPRFIQHAAAEDAVFANQDASFLTATLRQQVLLTPRLTFQAYAQVLSGVLLYPSFFSASLAGRELLALGDLTPMTFTGDPTAHLSALNVNLVLRWEYRLGSTLYVVYTRSQQELPPPDGVASRSLLPARLLEGPVTQAVLVKWSYWWDA